MTQELATVSANSVIAESINTLDLSSVEGRVKTLNAINSAMSLDGMEETPLHVVDVVTTPGTMRDRKTGEEYPCQNTYLVTQEGTAYFTQSMGIARSINAICKMFPDMGRADGLECLTMVVHSQVLPNKNTLKTVELVA